MTEFPKFWQKKFEKKRDKCKVRVRVKEPKFQNKRVIHNITLTWKLAQWDTVERNLGIWKHAPTRNLKFYKLNHNMKELLIFRKKRFKTIHIGVVHRCKNNSLWISQFEFFCFLRWGFQLWFMGMWVIQSLDFWKSVTPRKKSRKIWRRNFYIGNVWNFSGTGNRVIKKSSI